MSRRRAAGFGKLETPKLRRFRVSASFRHDAYLERATSESQKLVDRACTAETEAIKAIIAGGDLDEMIALELRLQKNDLEMYARSPDEMRGVEQGLADLQSGIHMHSTLKLNPGQYRELAKGFTDRNRDKKLDVPKDGMRYALGSQATRLRNRHFLQLSEPEKILLVARRALVDAMLEIYSAMQTEAVHGGAETEAD